MDATLRCTQLALKALALLDEGEDLGLDETQKHAQDGTLLSWLEEESGGRIEFSFYEDTDKAELSDRFASLANAVGTSDLGVTRSGLALVVAYCLEVIQQDRQRR